jgi:hypothetical protein
MRLHERELTLPAIDDARQIAGLGDAVRRALSPAETPVRFVVTESASGAARCELGVLEGDGGRLPSIFDFQPRRTETADRFTAVFLVPTGVGAEIGGFDGDAAPAAMMLTAVCDRLITHPNAVNGADLNELPRNGLYLEGSVIARLMMGQIGLQPVRRNRVLVVLGSRREPFFVDAAVNAVNAARAAYGLDVRRVLVLDEEIRMVSRYTPSGRAVGVVDGLGELFARLDEHRGGYDAVAIASAIEVDDSIRRAYYAGERVVNPWGGVEAMLTHTVALRYGVNAAHAPMYDRYDNVFRDHGVVDPRIAPEVISYTFLQCVFKGLQRAPRIVTDPALFAAPDVITAADVSCLIVPDGCVGLPTLAALAHGIPVLAVRENRNVMRNDLAALPWAPGQLRTVDNYWEAAGVIACWKAGIAPEAARRPFAPVAVSGRQEAGVRAPLRSVAI